MEAWCDDVRAALEHLDQDGLLAASPLCARLPGPAAESDARARAASLRRTLLDAMELLRPSHPLPFGSRESRTYDVLTLRFIELLSSREIAEELGVSERQVYRDLRQAVEQLAALILPPPTAPTGPITSVEPSESTEDALLSEVERVVPHPRRVDLAAMVAGIATTLQLLAQRYQAALTGPEATEPALVSADEGLLRQMVAQALSAVIQSARGGAVRWEVRQADEGVTLELSRQGGDATLDEGLLSSLRALAELQGATVEAEADATSLCLTLPAARPDVVLVIEDNEGAVELYRRYLVPSGEWMVTGVTDPRVALEVVRSIKPDVILLDIMMPRHDGWSVLQTLRGHPDTAHIPVVVCSVFADTELAAALGAAGHLSKPVSRGQLAEALRSALTRRPQEGQSAP